MGYDAFVTPGSGGQFDVLADGTLVYSKATTGRFPDDGEVAGLLAA
jgi:predicted Rdx family selenoprotein